jgi:hypothetical protein
LLNSSEHTAGKKTDKEDKNQLTWKEAFFASPGPASVKKAGLLSLKGLCMGSADVIPGVSGGTIALITGIYEDLIGALKSIDATMVKKALQFNLKEALSGVHIRFFALPFYGNRYRHHQSGATDEFPAESLSGIYLEPFLWPYCGIHIGG